MSGQEYDGPAVDTGGTYDDNIDRASQIVDDEVAQGEVEVEQPHSGSEVEDNGRQEPNQTEKITTEAKVVVPVGDMDAPKKEQHGDEDMVQENFIGPHHDTIQTTTVDHDSVSLQDSEVKEFSDGLPNAPNADSDREYLEAECKASSYASESNSYQQAEKDNTTTSNTKTLSKRSRDDTIPAVLEPEESDTFVESSQIQNSLNLEWVVGMNKDIVGGVHNLSDNHRKEVFYVSGHIGVILDYEKRKQTLLQGHTNEITCVCVSSDKRWIATCDAGDESMVVVWDSIKGIPVKTIFDPHPNGIQSIHISHDSMYLVSLGCPEEDGTFQTVSVWEWASESVAPVHSCTFPISANHDNANSAEVYDEADDGDKNDENNNSNNYADDDHDNGSSFEQKDQENDMSLSQTLVRFHPDDSKYFITCGPNGVIFWGWKDGELESFIPSVDRDDLRDTVGCFTQGTFIPGTHMAATATVDGKVIIWDVKSSSTTDLEKYVLKVVEVHKHSRINFLSTIGKYLVTGGEDGFVRFFDHQLRLEAWFEDFDAGPIISVSFEKQMHVFQDFYSNLTSRASSAKIGSTSRQGNMSTGRKYFERQSEFDGESSIDQHGKVDSFDTPNFVVGTKSAVIIHVESNSFVEINSETIKGKIIVQGQSGPVQCLACHPSKPYLAISGFSGFVHIWNYEAKSLITFIRMNGLFVSALQFDPNGEYMVAGCTNGVVKVFEATSFCEVQSFKTSKNSIQSIQFSHDSVYFAFYDTDNCVGIFRWDYRDEDKRKPVEWVYVGRYRSHKKSVTGIQFGVPMYGETPRLMSVGEDRRLVEYNLHDSSITEGVKVKAVHKIGQSAIPTAFLWVSRNADYITTQYPNESYKGNCLLFANDHYKFNNFLTPDDNDTRCTKTSLCPIFGGPPNRMILVPRDEQFLRSDGLENENGKEDNPEEEKGQQRRANSAPEFLAYSTHSKVIGLIYLPLDGNPSRSMGLVAHSGVITDCVVSFDGRYLFTAGGTDHTVNIWSIKGEYLREEATKTPELEDGVIDTHNTEPYVRLLEGGRQGKFFAEIKQFFYYAQIRSQGEVTTSERKITGRVPLSQIPDVVRALGFYVSHYETHSLLNEMTLALGYDPDLSLNLQDITVDFDTFVKLFVNHRPVLSTTIRDIKNAFVTAGAEPMSGIIFSESFFHELMHRGEAMNEADVNTALSILMEEEVTHSILEERFSAEQFGKLLDFTQDEGEDNLNDTDYIEGAYGDDTDDAVVF